MKIALPVETIVRELKGKLWLALNFVDEGHEVVFGELSSMKQGLDVIQPDVFFRTSTVYSEAKLEQNRCLQDSGADIVVLDTEGGAFKTPEQYASRRLFPVMLDTVDRFFAWGAESGSIVGAAENFSPEQTIVTGNPRFDVLHDDLRDVYREEAAAIQSRFGEYLLINTNFGRVNAHDRSGDVPTDDPKGELFHSFVDLAASLDEALPDLSVIIRPHPGENHDTYDRYLDTSGDVYVEHDGDVRSWIYGAEAVIHNNCTTGIEAALMERPVFAYTPVELEESRTHLSNRVSTIVATESALLDELRSLRETPHERSPLEGEQRETLRRYIHNVDESATEAILEAVEELDGDWNGGAAPTSLGDRVKRLLVEHLGVETTERLLEKATDADYSKLRQKFPGLTESELVIEIERFAPYVDTDQVTVEQIEQLGYVYRLAPDASS